MRAKCYRSRERLCFFRDSCVGSVENRPVKAAGAEVGAQQRNQKLHAAVAKRTFGSENAKKVTVSEHFLKFRCRKIARRCGEKHIQKSKCIKHIILGALFEVLMSKNCTPLWREAHSEVKMLKTEGRGTLKFRCRKKCTPLWREAHSEVKM